MHMTRLVTRPGTSDDVLEPLVTIVLLHPVRRHVPVLVHLSAALEPAALAYEPAGLARAYEQVGERAPARGLDVHHSLDART